jgi:hypothetical protein
MVEKTNWFIKLCNWIAGFFSAESETSSKRAIAFVLTGLHLYLNIKFEQKVTDKVWLFYQQVLNIVTILLIIGVATIQDVMKFFKRFKPGNDDTTKGG